MTLFEKTKLDRVLLIKPEIFEDFRGEYVEIYNEKLYIDNINTINHANIKFVEDDISISMRRSLKGVHGDDRTWKLISCLYGKFYLVVINYDKDSKEFGKWQGFTLSDKNRFQILVPPKFGNGHVALSEMSIFGYKQSEYYDPKRQFTIVWNDPRFDMWWPVKSPIVSIRDSTSSDMLGEFLDRS